MTILPPGRWTAQIDGDFVVLLIGFRVRLSPRVLPAVPLLLQMPRMLRDLSRDPSKGLLGFQQHGGPRGVIVQYWRSFEDLERFARNPDDRHARVWREWFRRAQHQNSSVGIWHETYRVSAGQCESVYQGMPSDFGLLAAGTATRIGSGVHAATRIGARESDLATPVEI